jgi:methionyl-tRNA formyltransferase
MKKAPGARFQMRVVYLGTPSFAVPSLERIVDAGHLVCGVFTQPDRPKGRGQKDTMPPVKEAALRLGLEVHQPERVRRPEVVELLRAMAPDLMVVVGYGQIIPQTILDIPPHGIINVHASLLPKYRGAAPIQWAIARGEKTTGVTTMKIDAGLDTGAMLLKWETEIGDDETAIELGARLAPAGAELLVRTLDELPGIVPEAQDDAQATLAPILKREDGHIDWSAPPQEILNRARGFQPWPGAYGFLKGQRFHVWRGAIAERRLAAGALSVEGKRLFAGCGGGAIELLEIQLEGKKRMAASAFLNGFPIAAGEVLA